MTTIVYRYGITAPIENASIVHEQMRLAHEYRCTLVRIECARRAAVRQVQIESSAELREAVAAVTAADDECKRIATSILAMRKQERKRAESATMRTDLTDARARLKIIRQTLYAVRSRYAPQCKDCRKAKSEAIPCEHAAPEATALRNQLDSISSKVNELWCSARGHSRLAWGTYLVVERAMRESCKAPLFEKDGITPHNPSLPPRDAPRAVAIQIQSPRPLSTEQAFAGHHSFLRLTAPPWPEAWLADHVPSPSQCRPQGAPFDPHNPLPQPSARRLAGQRPDGSIAPTTRADGSPARWVRNRSVRHGEVRMIVDRDGQWASFRLDYHRPLPPQASITWAIIKRISRGPHFEWSLHLTVDTVDKVQTAVQITPDHPASQVAIDVGWRQIGDELRVAVCSDGTELRLSAIDLRALRQADQIRSERDVAFDLCKLTLRARIMACPDLPAWMQEAARYMPNWHRQSRMVMLLNRWTAERPKRGADETVAYDAVAAWALVDRHRWAEQEARRIWGKRRRREKYRVWASQLSRKYGTIVVERFDLREVAERAPVGEDESENETARGNRHLAAISELRGCWVNSVAKGDGILVGVNAADSTRTCPGCGEVDRDDTRDAAASVVLTCRSCAAKWDQDEAASHFLLARYSESPGDAIILAGARAASKNAEPKQKKGSQWARARRMSTNKKARIEAARKKVG